MSSGYRGYAIGDPPKVEPPRDLEMEMHAAREAARMAAAAAAVAAVAAPAAAAAAPAAASSPNKKESVAVAMETAQKGVPEKVLDAKIQGSPVLRTELENGIRAIRSMTDAQFYDFGIACKDWVEKNGMQIWPDPVVFASSKPKLPTSYSALYNSKNNNNNNTVAMKGPTRGGAGGPPPGRKSRKNRKGKKSRKGIKSRKNNRKY